MCISVQIALPSTSHWLSQGEFAFELVVFHKVGKPLESTTEEKEEDEEEMKKKKLQI